MNSIQLSKIVSRLDKFYCQEGRGKNISKLKDRLNLLYPDQTFSTITDICKFLKSERQRLISTLHYPVYKFCNTLKLNPSKRITEKNIEDIQIDERVDIFTDCSVKIQKILQAGKTGVFVVDITTPEAITVPKILKIERSGSEQIQDEAKVHVLLGEDAYYFQTLVARIGGINYPAVLMDYLGYSLTAREKTKDNYEKAKQEFHEIHQRGIIHDDVKTENMVYDPLTQGIHLIDFGGALIIEKPDFYKYGVITRATVAPYYHLKYLVPSKYSLFPVRMVDDYLSLAYSFMDGEELPWEDAVGRIQQLDEDFVNENGARRQVYYRDLKPDNLDEYVYKMLMDKKSDFHRNFQYSYESDSEYTIGDYLDTRGLTEKEFEKELEDGYDMNFKYFRNEILFIYKTYGIQWMIAHDDPQIPNWLVKDITRIGIEEFGPEMSIHRLNINKSIGKKVITLLNQCKKDAIGIYPEHLDARYQDGRYAS